MLTLSTSKKGLKGEKYAEDLLKKKGYKIIEKNFRSMYGEIDIIAKKGGCLYFCEVKTRWSKSYGFPEESINNDKLNKIKKTIYYYLKVKKINTDKIQIMVVSQQMKERKFIKQSLIIYE